jgi:outer membrane biosynthesis protein TonB
MKQGKLMQPSRIFAVLLLLALCLSGGGCKKRAAQAAPVVIVSPTATEPEKPAPAAAPASQPEAPPEKKAEETPELVVPPAKRPATRPAPSRPASEPASPPAETAPKPSPPKMLPRLTPAEQAEYERRTNEAMADAERNLQKSYGRTLNAAQADLVEKIRGFLAQSREAMRDGDWPRARNLAEKARTLGVELASSL